VSVLTPHLCNAAALYLGSQCCAEIFSFLLSTSSAFSDDGLGLPTAEPESLGMSSKKLDETKTKLQPLIDEKKVSGFVTVVAHQGKVVHFEAFGSMDVERKKAMQADTILRIPSRSTFPNLLI